MHCSDISGAGKEGNDFPDKILTALLNVSLAACTWHL